MNAPASAPPVVFLTSSSCSQSPMQNLAAMWLAARGYPLVLVGPSESPEPYQSTPLGRIPADPFPAGGSVALNARLLVRLLRQRRRWRDRALFFVNSSPVCPAAWLGLAGLPRTRVLYQTQDFLQPGRHPHWEFFERRLARRAGAVISNEPNRALALARQHGLPAVPAVVRTALPAAWPCPERDAARRAALLARFPAPAPADACLVHVGGPHSRVRCSDVLLDAVATLPDRYRLVFSGVRPGSDAQDRTQAALDARGLASRAVLLEFLSVERLFETFADADIGILLYPNDGTGNYYQQPGRLSEYVRCGLPFVTSAFPGLEPLVRAHGLGAAVDPASSAAVAAALRDLGERPPAGLEAERERLRRVGRETLCYDRDAPVLEGAVRALLETLA